MNHPFTHIGVCQSEWIGELLNKYMPDVGYFVEIGVGHTTTQKSRQSRLKTVELFNSNTAELLIMGWSGIYIEPIKQLCDEAELLHKDMFDRLKIVCVGASDIEENCVMYGKETFIPNGILEYKDDLTGYKYDYPGMVLPCKPTSKILEENGCPSKIDFMSVDVEGYEIKVLKGINFEQHRPSMLFIETNKIGWSEVEKIIPSYYKMVRDDGLNTCWVQSCLI